MIRAPSALLPPRRVRRPGHDRPDAAQPQASRGGRRAANLRRAHRPHLSARHDAFTEGLFYLDGQLYESTGLVGRSTIRRVRLEDGQVLQSVRHPGRPVRRGHRQLGRPDHQPHLAGRDRLSLGPAHPASARRVALSGRRLGADPQRHRHRDERRHAAASLPRPRDPGRAPAPRRHHPRRAARSG